MELEITAYRYASEGEVRLVRSSSPYQIPNRDRAGRPKDVYLTWNYFETVNEAERGLQIGRLHPAGPSSPPSSRLHARMNGVNYKELGRVHGGSAIEVVSRDLVPVLAIHALR